MRKFLVISYLISCYPIFSQYYTGSNIPFGQNRVQYNSFYWQSYDFQRSKVYFTKGGEDHAQFASKVAYEFQLELEDKKTFLNSFIISNTPFRILSVSDSNNDSIKMYHSYNIYFQEEDKNTYIENVLKKGLIENF